MKESSGTGFRNLAAVVATLVLAAGTTWAAQGVPPDLADLVYQSLDFGQRQMSKRGYEIVYSTPAGGGSQYWWNRGVKTCVFLKIDGRRIGGLSSVDQSVCRQHLRDAYQSGGGYPGTVGPARPFRLEEKQTAHCTLTNVVLGKDLFNGLCSVKQTVTRNRSAYAVRVGVLQPIVFARERGSGYVLVHTNGTLEPVRFKDRVHQGVFRWGDFRLEVDEFH